MFPADALPGAPALGQAQARPTAATTIITSLNSLLTTTLFVLLIIVYRLSMCLNREYIIPLRVYEGNGLGKFKGGSDFTSH